MNTYKLNTEDGLQIEIPFDRLTAQLQRQGLIVSLPHELEINFSYRDKNDEAQHSKVNNSYAEILLGKLFSYYHKTQDLISQFEKIKELE